MSSGLPMICSVRSCSGEKITSRSSRYSPVSAPWLVQFREDYGLPVSVLIARGLVSRSPDARSARQIRRAPPPCARAAAARHPNAKMSPMTQSLGGFRAALLAGWTALSAAGLLYARSKGIPAWVAVPVLAAFLSNIHSIWSPHSPKCATDSSGICRGSWSLSFVAPYVLYASNTGQFRWRALAQLAALATALGLWYKILPAAPLADGAFLVLVAAVVLRGYFDPIYTSPVRGLHLEILGHVALTRVCAMVMLVERRVPGVGYGFMPSLTNGRSACGISSTS